MIYIKLSKYVAVFLTAIVLVSPVVSFAQQSDVDPLGNSVCVNISHPLRYGVRDTGDSNDVSMLQDFLNSNGYLSVSSSGFFGKSTLRAVKTFQLRNGLVSTGYVGPLTIGKIHDIDCGSNHNNQNTYCPPYASRNIPNSVRVLSPNGGEYFTLAPGDHA